jgi:hypothetical protein
MAQQHLGQPDLARRTLERLEALDKDQSFPGDITHEQRTALVSEAASVVRGRIEQAK